MYRNVLSHRLIITDMNYSDAWVASRPHQFIQYVMLFALFTCTNYIQIIYTADCLRNTTCYFFFVRTANFLYAKLVINFDLLPYFRGNFISCSLQYKEIAREGKKHISLRTQMWMKENFLILGNLLWFHEGILFRPIIWSEWIWCLLVYKGNSFS